MLWDRMKPVAEMEMMELPPGVTPEVNVLDLWCNMIAQEEKAEYFFNVTGAHALLLEPMLMKRGIKRVHGSFLPRRRGRLCRRCLWSLNPMAGRGGYLY